MIQDEVSNTVKSYFAILINRIKHQYFILQFRMNRIAPQWIVENLENTLSFYTEKLGFKVDWSGTLFAIVSCGSVTIMLRQLNKEGLKRPNKIPFVESGWHTDREEAWDAYVWADNVDDLYDSLKKRNVRIIKKIQNSEYGNRDFEIEDINGYILCFGQTI